MFDVFALPANASTVRILGAVVILCLLVTLFGRRAVRNAGGQGGRAVPIRVLGGLACASGLLAGAVAMWPEGAMPPFPGLAGNGMLGLATVLGLMACGLLLPARSPRDVADDSVRLKALTDLAIEGLLTCRDDRIITCNDRFRILTGLQEGDDLHSVFTAEALAQLRAAPDTFQQIGILSPGGEVIPVEATLRLLVDAGTTDEVIALRDLRAQRQQQADRERSIQARLESEQRFRFLIQSVTDYAIYMLNPDGRVANWNAGAERNKGYTAEEIVGRHFSVFFSRDDRAEGLPARMLDRALRTGKVETSGWRYRKDGSRFWASVLLEPIFDDAGQHIGFAKVTHDNTRQLEDAEALRLIRHKLALALENLSQGIALFDEKERLVLGNARLSEILNIPEPDGLSLDDFTASIAEKVDLSSGSLEGLHKRHRGLWHGTTGTELLLDLTDGRTIMVIHRPVREGGWVTTVEDVSARTRSERQITHMARHDALTGLPNRTSFKETIEWALDDVRDRPGHRLAVMAIDLDRFKEINDHMGHAVGDQVLAGLARRLEATLRGNEFVARFGGDEFAAFKTIASEEELTDFQTRLLQAIGAEMSINGNEVSVGASVGIALFPEDANTFEKLMANADLAMYRAKSSLDEKVCRYESRMDEASRDRQAMARDLWRAVERGELYLHHQIQKSVSTGETTGYEVLLRWMHPERGLVSPADFIPLAEECGAIMSIGDWVLRTACQQAAAWRDKIRIAVNLSPVQLNNPRFVAQLEEILHETGIEPDRLELEVTESAIIPDKARALHMLNQVKALGVTVAIDDFGTGYSSLDTLRSFPFDKIKLDRSFIREVETSPQSKAIIRAILALGRSLEVPVLAEGVETPAQLSLLQSEGCDEAQGYFLGRPGVLSLPETPSLVA
ncbi:sensor domain-containing protein [Falsirhodobacter sp. 20TX0035]|uniref:sensor domain-containing protein n=1 Tax=Falsirhodobacter sp. 20TX0035 TaxID=3022019 RepID=UPI00233014EA|nr:EAL domain-containing protein [Falsirhodobacter sp. 20TX0035]MDB6453087.1 EAL domain-containing protein [Falsirhodobacter sp. 20TX0035]